jgi:energy-coupling factor transporter ATP-binding protein EcfA2
MIFATLAELRDACGKTLIFVEQNARKGLEFADVGCVLVAGRLVKAGHSKELLSDPDMADCSWRDKRSLRQLRHTGESRYPAKKKQNESSLDSGFHRNDATDKPW